jgi:hypothetical protein
VDFAVYVVFVDFGAMFVYEPARCLVIPPRNMRMGRTYLATTFGSSLPTLPESSRSGYRNAVMYAVSVMPHSCVMLTFGESMLTNCLCRALSSGATAHQIHRSEASVSVVTSG